MNISLTVLFDNLDELYTFLNMKGVIVPVVTPVPEKAPDPKPEPMVIPEKAIPAPPPVKSDIRCKNCNKPFIPQKKGLEYCSKKCYSAAYQRMYYKRKHPPASTPKQDDKAPAGEDEFHKKLKILKEKYPIKEINRPPHYINLT